MSLQPARRAHPTGWLATLALCGLLALAFGLLPPPEVRTALWQAWGAWIVASGAVAALALMAAQVPEFARRAPGQQGHAMDALAATLIVAVAFLLWRQVVPEMRILADEALLVGTSFGLHLTGEPLVPAAAYYDASGALHVLSFTRDQRGLLFPLLLEGMHATLGYSPRHGLALNALLLAAIPLLVYGGLRRTLPVALAFAGAMLALAHPVLVWCGASSGFEPLNLVLLLGCWVAAQAATRRPSASRWLLLAVLGALAAQARYESVLFGAVMMLLAVRGLWRLNTRYAGYALALVPLLHVPFLWQRAMPFVHGLDQIAAEHAFGLDLLARNLARAARLMFVPSGLEPLGPLILLLALVLVASVLTRRHRTDAGADTPTNAALVLGVLAAMSPILLHAWGDLGGSVTARLGLPLLMLASVLAAYGLHWLCGDSRRRCGAAAALAVLLCLATVPAVRADYAGHRQVAGLAHNATLAWLDAGPRCRPLFVATQAPYYVIHGHSAISVEDLGTLWPRVREWAHDGAIDAVWMVDLRTADGTRLPAQDEVPGGFAARAVTGPGIPISGVGELHVLALDRPDAPLGRDCAATGSRPVH